MKCLDQDPQRGSESMTQTVLTADSPDSRQPAYTDRQQTAGHPGPGGGGVAGECGGLLTWRGGAVTRPNIDGSAPAQPPAQPPARSRGDRPKAYIQEKNWPDLPRLRQRLETVQYTVEYLVVSQSIASVKYYRLLQGVP